MEHFHAFQGIMGLRELCFGAGQCILRRSGVDRSQQLTALHPLTFTYENPVERAHTGETHGGGRLFFHLSHIGGPRII